MLAAQYILHKGCWYADVRHYQICDNDKTTRDCKKLLRISYIEYKSNEYRQNKITPQLGSQNRFWQLPGE